ncbi:MAG: hypothetical protein OQK77_04245 [Psychromonas sp.]|nr:hypothetical protein [Psychromonas sp.]
MTIENRSRKIMQQADLQTWQGSVGNQWGRKVSRNPTLATPIIGSHSDAVAGCFQPAGLDVKDSQGITM